MKFAIGLETIRRPDGTDYFGQTLANLTRAGVFKSELLSTFRVAHGEGFTRQQNGQRAIAMAAADVNADWVIKLEDDLDFVDNFLENVAAWLEDFGHANTCLFSLGASFETVSHSRFCDNEVLTEPGPSFPTVREYLRRGEHCVPHRVGGYWGAQALVMRRADALDLATFLGPDPALWDGVMHHKNRGHDLMLQCWGSARGVRSFACTVPSFVQHIGRVSNLSQPELQHVQPFFEFPWPGHKYEYIRRSER
jgi:hypothetical protein